MSGPTATRPSAVAVRAATETFVYVMRRFQVRTHELALETWGHAGRFRVARPFWPVTLESEDGPSGYGINTDAVVIRYTQSDFPLAADETASTPMEFGPGCRELLARTTSTKPAFVCEPLGPEEVRCVVADFLFDAAMSLADGCGPVVIGVVSAAPPRDKLAGVLECSTPWRPSSPKSSTESCPADSSTKTTTSSRS
jgi:hypothetical protein